MKKRMSILAALVIGITGAHADTHDGHNHDHDLHYHGHPTLLSKDPLKLTSVFAILHEDHASLRRHASQSEAMLHENDEPGQLTLSLYDHIDTGDMTLFMITDITGDYREKLTDRHTLRGEMVNNHVHIRHVSCQAKPREEVPAPDLAQRHDCQHLITLLEGTNTAAGLYRNTVDTIVWGEDIDTTFTVTIAKHDDANDHRNHDDKLNHHDWVIRNQYQAKPSFPSGIKTANRVTSKVGNFERIAADNVETQLYKDPVVHYATLHMIDHILIGTHPATALNETHAIVRLKTFVSAAHHELDTLVSHDRDTRVKVTGECSGNREICAYVNNALASGLFHIKDFEKGEEAMAFSVVIGNPYGFDEYPTIVNRYVISLEPMAVIER